MSYEEAMELADDILSDLDDIPERGEEFADSVREKVESMRIWIEENEKVTPLMIVALENMRQGVDRWLR